jgi:histidine triad (HIT) family protein
MSEQESAALMDGIRRAARAIDWAEHRPGIAIWQNNGIPAHQTIPHVHFHVAGTLPGGGTEWGPVPELSLADTDAIVEKLKSSEAKRST